jgi:hypothetical protein
VNHLLVEGATVSPVDAERSAAGEGHFQDAPVLDVGELFFGKV